MKRIPRAAAVLALTLGAVALHAALPFELSRLGGRVGRSRRTGPAVRGAGLGTVAAGAALMAWAVAAHYQAAPRGWALQPPPTPGHVLRRAPYRLDYLLRKGPYGLTRNPMYIGEAAIWLGWALFYGSPAVWAGLAILCAAFVKVVPWRSDCSRNALETTTARTLPRCPAGWAGPRGRARPSAGAQVLERACGGIGEQLRHRDPAGLSTRGRGARDEYPSRLRWQVAGHRGHSDPWSLL